MKQRQVISDFVYGKNPVREIFRAGKRTVKELLLAGNREKWENQELFKLAQSKKVPLKFVHDSELNRISMDGIHQGVLAKVASYPNYNLDEVFDDQPKKMVLILDSITDPQNFGTICRSALVFGVKEVILPKDKSVPITAVACKASAGAIEHLKIIYVTNLVRTMEELKEKGFWIYGGSLAPQSVSLEKVKPGPKSAIVLGAEGEGLRQLVEKSCDQLMKIPMASDFDSLNVAQAGTVMMYEFRRKMDVL